MGGEHRIKFPNIRMSGTSWVVPRTLAENLRYLSREVNDMEIVLFDTPQGSNIPTKDEVLELRGLCGELGMTCNVHFPFGVCGPEDEAEIMRYDDSCMRMIELFEPLEPSAWVLHIDGNVRRTGTPSDNIDKWRENARKSLARIGSSVPDKKKICAETLDYDFDYVFDIVKEAGLSVCLDIGHLIIGGYPVRERIEKYLPDAGVVHIHGVRPDGTDHVDMSYFDPALFRRIVSLCADGRERIMSIEVFEEDYDKSIAAIKGFSI
ncbi:MAG: cobamide remodeling phosphodiesterase CbiR [Synergistaceae bacterium]|nr:cobamide remodeling phosphodiesterase CbiR [Synergistaceae bacterium]